MTGTADQPATTPGERSPITETRHLPGVQVLAVMSVLAVIIAVTVATQTYLSMRTHGHSFTRMLVWQLACWLFWALAAPWVLQAGARLGRTAATPQHQWMGIVGLGAALTA